MARTLYKTIAVVLFVLVTIQYFYFYPLKNGGGAMGGSSSGLQTAPAIIFTTSLSSSGGASETDMDSTQITPTTHPPPPLPPAPPQAYLWRQPHENSVFYILNHFSPPPHQEEEEGGGDPTSSSVPVPRQEPQLISLLNQANSRLNQSIIVPHAARLKSAESLEGKVSFLNSSSSSGNSSSSSSPLLVSNITKLSENQSIILVTPLNHHHHHPNPNLNQSNITMMGVEVSNSSGSLSLSSTLSPLPSCPSVSPLLMGFVRVRLQAPSLADIGRQNNELSLGGHYSPASCQARSRVAIIVPFRDREDHLRLFLHNLIPMLKRQQLEFNIFVIEQGGSSKNEPFNRAMLFNVGFVEANKRYPHWQCFIFHDVDLIPENDYNLYDCPVQPRHMSVAVDKMKYKLPYKTIFGGISSLTKEHFLKVNGFSNMFWGWGAEDDDMAGRIAFHGLFISRPSPSVARYKMLKHRQQKLNQQRYKVLQKGKHRFNSDGLSNLNYTVEQIILEKTHTLIRVQLLRVGEAG